jgi:hypothetical protein
MHFIQKYKQSNDYLLKSGIRLSYAVYKREGDDKLPALAQHNATCNHGDLKALPLPIHWLVIAIYNMTVVNSNLHNH